jgi:hypothetical protein
LKFAGQDVGYFRGHFFLEADFEEDLVVAGDASAADLAEVGGEGMDEDGKIQASNPARIIQLAAKYTF